MTYVRRVVFGMAASTVVVTIIYLGGLLISGWLTRRDAMSSGADTVFVQRHWHLWPIAGIALVAFAVGFAKSPRTQ